MGEIINYKYEFDKYTFFLESPYDDWFHTPEFIEDLTQLTDKDYKRYFGCFHGEE